MARTGANLTDRALGSVLCIAAGLKAANQFASPADQIGRIFELGGASIELIVGVALLLRFWQSVMIPAAALFFALLTGVSLIGGLRGVASCGCLGAVAVPPWAMFAFDVVAATALLARLWVAAAPSDKRSLALPAAALASLYIGVSVGSMVYPNLGPLTTSPSPEAIAAASTVVIEPGRLAGRSFPFLEYIRIDADLSRGRWKLILARSGCRRCDQRLRSGECQPVIGERTAVVLTDYKEGWTLPPECPARLGRLSQEKTWIFESPLVIRLVDGRVSEAR